MQILPVQTASSSPPSYRSQRSSRQASELDLVDALRMSEAVQASSSQVSLPNYMEDLLSRRPPTSQQETLPSYTNRFQDTFLTGDRSARGNRQRRTIQATLPNEPEPPSKAIALLAFLASGALGALGFNLRDANNRQFSAPMLATFCGLAAPIAAGGLVQLYRIYKYHTTKREPVLPTTSPAARPDGNTRTPGRESATVLARNPANPATRLDTQQALMTPPLVRIGLLIAQLARGNRQDY